MALALRTDEQGYTHCTCGVRFKNHHVCRRPLGERVTRRPAGFEELVEDAAAQARAEAEEAAAAQAQMSIDDLANACTRCGRTDRHVDHSCGLCTACLAADARAQRDRITDWRRRTAGDLSPP